MLASGEFLIERLSGSIGARVTGVRLADLPETDFRLIQTAWTEHPVLVFPDQDFSVADHVRFGRMFGELTVHPYHASTLEEHPEVMELRNSGKASTITEIWHSDTSALPQPPMATIVAMRVLPRVGGDTMFSSQYLAYEALSSGMKRLLDGVRAIHERDGIHGSVAHPAVRTHPVSGRKALYVNAAHVSRLENMTAAESAPLLNYLFDHAVRPDFTYRHRWGPRDVVVWDNRCVMHYAIHDIGDEPRVIHRVNVLGETPE